VIQPPPEVLEARRSAVELISADAVSKAIDQVAVRMTVALAECNPLFLCVLEGGIPFMGRLLGRLDFPLQAGHVHVGRYGDELEGHSLAWHSKPDLSLAGQHVVFIDDILDQGITLAELRTWALKQGAERVSVAVLVNKRITGAEARPIQADFVALECADHFLIGCGMDFKGYWRNLPAIYALADRAQEATSMATDS
jgi:hypoxanthine phosphoribosyltransferase